MLDTNLNLLLSQMGKTEEQKQLEREAYEAAKKSIATRENLSQQSLNQYEALKNRPQQLDLSPLLAYADSFNKTNLLQSYKKPLSPEERATNELKLLVGLGEQEGDIATSKINLARSLQGQDDQTLQQVLRLQALQAKDQRADKNFDFKKYQAVQGLVNKAQSDKVVSKSNESISAGENVLQLANSNNPLADNSIPTFLARASGEVGALSESDKKPFGGEQSLQGRIQQTLQMTSEGRLTPENRKFVIQLAETFKRNGIRNRARRLNELGTSYAKVPGAPVTLDELKEMLMTPEDIEELDRQEQEKQQKPKPINLSDTMNRMPLTPEQARQELLRRRQNATK